MAKFSVCRIYKVTLWLNFSYNYSVNLLQISHLYIHPIDSGAFCLRHRARDPISVAFFDRVALFSDFNHLFELLDQVLLPIAVVPFIYWNYAQKTF